MTQTWAMVAGMTPPSPATDRGARTMKPCADLTTTTAMLRIVFAGMHDEQIPRQRRSPNSSTDGERES